jgi:ketosteroid isomerase-like protein
MSQENVEIARRMFERVPQTLAGEKPDFFQWLAPEVEWLTLATIIEGTRYHGHDGVRRWIEDVRRDWAVWELRTDEFLDLGDDGVLVFGGWHARSHGGDRDLDIQQSAWLLRFRDGTLRRLETFTDRSKALEAAGLAE